jgi:anti-sigma B factor antagonist
MHLRLVTREVDGATVVGVGGEIDNYTAPQLRDALSEALDGGATRLVVDLTDTDFLDSSALGVLVGVSKLRSPAGHSVVIACPNPQLRRLFQISRLDEVIRVCDSVDTAVVQTP